MCRETGTTVSPDYTAHTSRFTGKINRVRIDLGEDAKDADHYEASRQTLNMNLGGIDTLILFTSSWAVALAVQAIKRDLVDEVPRCLFGGAVTGLMFVSKSIEYFEKFANGITPATDPFYMWYFTLTGIHLTHVLVGTSLLTYLWIRSRRGVYNSSNRVVPECVASFWHLVDLLWIVLFPMLYLLRAA